MTRKKLRTMTLVGIIYFSVSGGPFGLEELISTSGAGIALRALIVVPIVFSVPTAVEERVEPLPDAHCEAGEGPDGYLPQALARDGRYGTPTAAILVSCAIFAVFCALDFATLVNADIITNLAALMLEFAAFIVLRRRYPNLVRPFVVRGGWVAVGLVVALPAALTVYMVISTFHEEPGALWVGLGILAFGVLLYPILTRFVKRGRSDAPVDIDLGAPARTATTAR